VIKICVKGGARLNGWNFYRAKREKPDGLSVFLFGTFSLTRQRKSSLNKK
jgi:hypothetical protein